MWVCKLGDLKHLLLLNLQFCGFDCGFVGFVFFLIRNNIVSDKTSISQ